MHVRALREQRVSFVDEEQDIELFRPREDAVQVLFRFTDVLVDHRGQVETIQIHLQHGREQAGSQRFARAARSAEQRAHAAVRLQP